jgi:hypothetical protein
VEVESSVWVLRGVCTNGDDSGVLVMDTFGRILEEFEQRTVGIGTIGLAYQHFHASSFFFFCGKKTREVQGTTAPSCFLSSNRAFTPQHHHDHTFLSTSSRAQVLSTDIAPRNLTFP